MQQVQLFFTQYIAPYISTEGLMGIVSLIIACLTLNFIAKQYLLRAVDYVIAKKGFSWSEAFLKHKPLNNLSKIAPTLLIYHFAKGYPSYTTTIENFSSAFIIFLVFGVIDDLLDTIIDIYSTYEISKTKPLKGYIQVLKIFLFCCGFVFVLSVILNKSPFYFLGSLGAMTAVLLLIFKDTILSLVASIQINTNQLIQIGDWIEMPKFNADGDVIDLTLHSVMVQNWDKTITSIPTHKFLDESFKNWRGMAKCGSRRISRSINIDLQSTKILDDELKQKLIKIDYLKNYLVEKEKEISQYNQVHQVGQDLALNGRQQTNIGLFRYYLLSYLKNHPRVDQNLTLIVRQQAPTEFGVPMQVYFFANTTVWADYEAIQADVFDHIFASAAFFDLNFYQAPSGKDFRHLKLA